LPKETRQVKGLKNPLDSDHGKPKRLIKPMLGGQSMCACAERVQSLKRGVPKTAYATVKGFEVMRMFKTGEFKSWTEALADGTEDSFVNRLFGIHI
jgi:transposase-like protein